VVAATTGVAHVRFPADSNFFHGTAWHCAGLSLDLAAWVFHGTAWYCAGLSLDVRFLPFALAFSAWRSLDVFAAPCFRDFCSLDVFTLVFSLEVFGAAPCFRLGR